MQLHGFLLVDESVDQMYGNDSIQREHYGVSHERQAAVEVALASLAMPSKRRRRNLASANGSVQQQQTSDADPEEMEEMDTKETLPTQLPAGLPQPSLLDKLDGQLLRLVLGNLDPQDLHRCMAAGLAALAAAAADVLQRMEQVCYFSKHNYQQEGEWSTGEYQLSHLPCNAALLYCCNPCLLPRSHLHCCVCCHHYAQCWGLAHAVSGIGASSRSRGWWCSPSTCLGPPLSTSTCAAPLGTHRWTHSCRW